MSGDVRSIRQLRDCEPRESCHDCDGRGFYTTWPHTTCPTCGGSGIHCAHPGVEDAS